MSTAVVDMKNPGICQAYTDIVEANILRWILMGYTSTPNQLRIFASGNGDVDEMKGQVTVGEICYGVFSEPSRNMGIRLAVIYIPDTIGGVWRARATVHGKAVAARFKAQEILRVSNINQFSVQSFRSALRLPPRVTDYVPSPIDNVPSPITSPPPRIDSLKDRPAVTRKPIPNQFSSPLNGSSLRLTDSPLTGLLPLPNNVTQLSLLTLNTDYTHTNTNNATQLSLLSMDTGTAAIENFRQRKTSPPLSPLPSPYEDEDNDSDAVPENAADHVSSPDTNSLIYSRLGYPALTPRQPPSARPFLPSDSSSSEDQSDDEEDRDRGACDYEDHHPRPPSIEYSEASDGLDDIPDSASIVSSTFRQTTAASSNTTKLSSASYDKPLPPIRTSSYTEPISGLPYMSPSPIPQLKKLSPVSSIDGLPIDLQTALPRKSGDSVTVSSLPSPPSSPEGFKSTSPVPPLPQLKLDLHLRSSLGLKAQFRPPSSPQSVVQIQDTQTDTQKVTQSDLRPSSSEGFKTQSTTPPVPPLPHVKLDLQPGPSSGPKAQFKPPPLPQSVVQIQATQTGTQIVTQSDLFSSPPEGFTQLTTTPILPLPHVKLDLQPGPSSGPKAQFKSPPLPQSVVQNQDTQTGTQTVPHSNLFPSSLEGFKTQLTTTSVPSLPHIKLDLQPGPSSGPKAQFKPPSSQPVVQIHATQTQTQSNLQLGSQLTRSIEPRSVVQSHLIPQNKPIESAISSKLPLYGTYSRSTSTPPSSTKQFLHRRISTSIDEEEERKLAVLDEERRRRTMERAAREKREKKEQEARDREFMERREQERRKRIENVRRVEMVRAELKRQQEEEEARKNAERERRVEEQLYRQSRVQERIKSLEGMLLLSGFISVLSGNTWRRRYYQLTTDEWRIYKDDEDMSMPLSVLTLTRIAAIREWDEGYEELEFMPNGFAVELADGDPWLLFADSQEEKETFAGLLGQANHTYNTQ